MKRYEVWCDCTHAGSTPDTVVLEFEDDAAQGDIENECSSVLDDLMGNKFESGWRELEPGELSTDEQNQSREAKP